MYVCMCVQYVCMYACMYVCMYVFILTFMKRHSPEHYRKATDRQRQHKILLQRCRTTATTITLPQSNDLPVDNDKAGDYNATTTMRFIIAEAIAINATI